MVSTYNQIVDGQECLWFGSLLLEKDDAVTGYFLRCHHNGIHVAAKQLGDSQLVLLMDRAAQVRQSAILGKEIHRSNERFNELPTAVRNGYVTPINNWLAHKNHL